MLKMEEVLRIGEFWGLGAIGGIGAIGAIGGVLPPCSVGFFKKILSVDRDIVKEFLFRGGRHLSNSLDILSGFSTKTDEKLLAEGQDIKGESGLDITKNFKKI